MMPRFALFARLSLANLRRHRARWLLTGLGVALGLTAFTGVTAMSESIVHAFAASIARTAGGAQLQVSNGTAGVDAGLVATVHAVPGVRAASGRVRYDVAVAGLDRRLTVLGVPFGGDEAGDTEFGPDVLDSPDRLEFLARTDSIALTAHLLTEAGRGLGSTLEVRGPKGTRTLTIRGVLRPTGALRVFRDDVALMDSDAAQHAFGRLDELHWIDVVVEPGAALDDVRAGIERAVAGRAVVDTPLGRGRRMEAMLGTLRTMLTLSAVVALLVGIFLIYHTVATAVRQRQDELIVLSTLGARRRHLVAHLLAEVTAVGLIGSVAGIGLGLGFARAATGAFTDVVSSMYAPVPHAGITITAAELAVALALGLSAVVAGAVVPCVRALKTADETPTPPPATLLAAAGVLAIVLGVLVAGGAYAVGFGTRVFAVAAFASLVFAGVTLLVPIVLAAASPLLAPLLRGTRGVLGTWMWAQVRKRPGDTAVTMGALAAGGAFALGMAILLGSYRHAFVGWIRQTFAADVFVNAGSHLSLLNGPTLDAALARELAGVPGVRRVMPWRLLEVEFAGRPIIVQGMAEELIDRAHPGVALDHARGEVVVSDTLSERYGVGVGDTLTLASPAGPLALRVQAVEPDYVIDLGNVKVGYSLFTRYFGEQGANVLLIDKDPEVSSDELKRRIEARAGGRYDFSVLTEGELHQLVDRLLDQSFALTRALELLAAMVTVCAMINATSAAIVDRADELVTLRALGMLRGRLVRLLVLEAALVGVLGSLLGLFAGSVLGGTFVVTVARAVAGFRFAVHWPLGVMLALTTVSVASAAAAAYFVARRWTRQVLDVGDETPAWRGAT
jgi:putative ABC transport system permease protein